MPEMEMVAARRIKLTNYFRLTFDVFITRVTLSSVGVREL